MTVPFALLTPGTILFPFLGPAVVVLVGDIVATVFSFSCGPVIARMERCLSPATGKATQKRISE